MGAVLDASIVPSQVACDPKTLPLGMVEAFVLSQVDGRSSLDDLASLAALSLAEVKRVVQRLHELGAVDLPGQARRRTSKRMPTVRPGGTVRPAGPRSGGTVRPGATVRPRRSAAQRIDVIVDPVFSPSIVPGRVGKQGPVPGARLGAKEGFVLAQIDGSTTVSDLAAITGFDIGALTQMLGELSRAGMIESKPAAAKTRAQSPAAAAIPPHPPPRSSVHPRRASQRMRQVEPPKEPGKPAASPPAASSDDACDLDAETRARVDELYGKLGLATLYEMLGVARDADKKVIKGAFFAFAATLHPDRHFRKRLGPYKQRINDVFVRLTLAYETLGTVAKRAEYDKKLPPLPVSDRPPPRRATVAPKQAARTSMRPRTSGRPRAPSAAPTPLSVAERRENLAARLGDLRPRAQGVPAIDPGGAMKDFFQARAEKVDKAGKQRARVFLDAAEEALAKNDFVAAATHFKLALECCDTPDIRTAFEAADVKARAKKFEVNVKLAEQAEQDRRWDEAATRYAKAHAARAEPRVAERLANALRLQGGEVRRAVKHAEEAVLGEPQNHAFRMTLAEVYAEAGLGARARMEVERVLSATPRDARAKALAARLAKMKA